MLNLRTEHALEYREPTDCNLRIQSAASLVALPVVVSQCGFKNTLLLANTGSKCRCSPMLFKVPEILETAVGRVSHLSLSFACCIHAHSSFYHPHGMNLWPESILWIGYLILDGEQLPKFGVWAS